MAKGDLIEGKRVHSRDDGYLILKDGEYGFDVFSQQWEAKPPGFPGVANLSNHNVVEHKDGTITVTPSILVKRNNKGDEWHGFLEKGIWREV